MYVTPRHTWSPIRVPLRIRELEIFGIGFVLLAFCYFAFVFLLRINGNKFSVRYGWFCDLLTIMNTWCGFHGLVPVDIVPFFLKWNRNFELRFGVRFFISGVVSANSSFFIHLGSLNLRFRRRRRVPILRNRICPHCREQISCEARLILQPCQWIPQLERVYSLALQTLSFLEFPSVLVNVRHACACKPRIHIFLHS